MLLVEVRGVRFPAYTDQIDFPYYHRFTKKKDQAPKKAPKKYIDEVPKEKNFTSVNKEEGVWLLLVPKFTLDDFNDEVVELFKLYVVNKNNVGYRFHYTQEFFGEEAFENHWPLAEK